MVAACVWPLQAGLGCVCWTDRTGERGVFLVGLSSWEAGYQEMMESPGCCGEVVQSEGAAVGSPGREAPGLQTLGRGAVLSPRQEESWGHLGLVKPMDAEPSRRGTRGSESSYCLSLWFPCDQSGVSVFPVCPRDVGGRVGTSPFSLPPSDEFQGR